MNDLEWRDNNLPVSVRFDDPYFSKDNGRAETSYVFIQGNRLPLRWLTMKHCTIAELGFGTGLNFLETVRQWREHRAPGTTLEFISFEQYPLERDQLEKALSTWPELADVSKQLIKLWTPVAGLTNLKYAEDITLTIHLGDANTKLTELGFLADAWYLDGFSPAKNPELWNEELLKQVAKHTITGGTFATYTAAGTVRRNLRAAGFYVQKINGYGRKRDMLIGEKSGDIDVAERP